MTAESNLAKVVNLWNELADTLPPLEVNELGEWVRKQITAYRLIPIQLPPRGSANIAEVFGISGPKCCYVAIHFKKGSWYLYSNLVGAEVNRIQQAMKEITASADAVCRPLYQHRPQEEMKEDHPFLQFIQQEYAK